MQICAPPNTYPCVHTVSASRTHTHPFPQPTIPTRHTPPPQQSQPHSKLIVCALHKPVRLVRAKDGAPASVAAAQHGGQWIYEEVIKCFE